MRGLYKQMTSNQSNYVQMRTLSLIIPCYNEGKTLAGIVERCLSLVTTPLTSAGAQLTSGLRLELVIVNDCSTDGSDAVARSLAGKHPGAVKYVAHEKNMGKGGGPQDRRHGGDRGLCGRAGRGHGV